MPYDPKWWGENRHNRVYDLGKPARKLSVELSIEDLTPPLQRSLEERHQELVNHHRPANVLVHEHPQSEFSIPSSPQQKGLLQRLGWFGGARRTETSVNQTQAVQSPSKRDDSPKNR